MTGEADTQVEVQLDSVSTPEEKTRAQEMGWRDSDQFQGDQAKWVDAKTFIEKGEHVLPIVKATAERLRGELTETRGELGTIKEALNASQETIKALERYHADDVKQKVENAKKKLKEEIIQAKKSGDVVGEVELTDELQQLNASSLDAGNKEDEEPPVKKREEPRKDYSKDPDFVEWRGDNSWYGTDRAKTALAHDEAVRLRREGNTLKGRAFMDEVTKGVNAEFAKYGNGGGGNGKSRVEPSRGGAGGNGGGTREKTYQDLPADAKAACDSYERELVGPNRLHKSRDDWRKSYVTRFFQE